jgi:hypothetical protein
MVIGNCRSRPISFFCWIYALGLPEPGQDASQGMDGIVDGKKTVLDELFFLKAARIFQ